MPVGNLKAQRRRWGCAISQTYLSLISFHPHNPQPCTAVFKLWELPVFTSPQVLWSLNLDPQLNFMIKHIWRYIFKLKWNFKNWYHEQSCSLGLYLLLWHGAIQIKAVTSIIHWVLTSGQAMRSIVTWCNTNKSSHKYSSLNANYRPGNVQCLHCTIVLLGGPFCILENWDSERSQPADLDSLFTMCHTSQCHPMVPVCASTEK